MLTKSHERPGFDPENGQEKDQEDATSNSTTEKPVGLTSCGRPSRKHGFRETGDKCRGDTSHACCRDCCCANTETDDCQYQATAKRQPSAEDDQAPIQPA